MTVPYINSCGMPTTNKCCCEDEINPSTPSSSNTLCGIILECGKHILLECGNKIILKEKL